MRRDQSTAMSSSRHLTKTCYINWTFLITEACWSLGQKVFPLFRLLVRRRTVSLQSSVNCCSATCKHSAKLFIFLSPMYFMFSTLFPHNDQNRIPAMLFKGFVHSFSPTRQTLEQCLKLGNDQFNLPPSQYFTCLSFYHLALKFSVIKQH
jgi:hypothetical protein